MPVDQRLHVIAAGCLPLALGTWILARGGRTTMRAPVPVLWMAASIVVAFMLICWMLAPGLEYGRQSTVAPR